MLGIEKLPERICACGLERVIFTHDETVKPSVDHACAKDVSQGRSGQDDRLFRDVSREVVYKLTQNPLNELSRDERGGLNGAMIPRHVSLLLRWEVRCRRVASTPSLSSTPGVVSTAMIGFYAAANSISTAMGAELQVRGDGSLGHGGPPFQVVRGLANCRMLLANPYCTTGNTEESTQWPKS